MSEEDVAVVCAKIDEEKEFLHSLSQDIWKMPELNYKEVHAHASLTCALTKHGFKVQKHYFIPTAFRAEFSSKLAKGPTIAVLCEYDALPEIGHACGHNLIAEAGVAAGIGIKAAMEADPKLAGKVVVLGTPAEEGGGGKLRLIELGAFDGIDAAIMAHPTRINDCFPLMLYIVRSSVEFKGKEAHASAYPWKGRNALDAAVACYNNLALLRQHIKPTCRINAIISKGGVAANVIPAESKLELYLRAMTYGELNDLKSRVEACINSAADATGCEVSYRFDENNAYKNLLTNEVLVNLYRSYAEDMGVEFNPPERKIKTGGSTDMGNVSHIVPAIHPFFSIPTDDVNHTKGFAASAGSPQAQKHTLIAAKALALTAIKLMRCPDTMNEAKRRFAEDVAEELSL